MKFVAIIEYARDHQKVADAHPAHRDYLRQYLENGQLCAAGPFSEDAGALWVIDAEDAQSVEQIVRGDPFVAAGVTVSWHVRPLAYWSAQEAKGSR